MPELNDQELLELQRQVANEIARPGAGDDPGDHGPTGARGIARSPA